MLAGEVNLRKLHFFGIPFMFKDTDPKQNARHVYEDIRDWLEAIGVRTGDECAGVEMISLPELTALWQHIARWPNWDGMEPTRENYAVFRQEFIRLCQ